MLLGRWEGFLRTDVTHSVKSLLDNHLSMIIKPLSENTFEELILMLFYPSSSNPLNFLDLCTVEVKVEECHSLPLPLHDLVYDHPSVLNSKLQLLSPIHFRWKGII